MANKRRVALIGCGNIGSRHLQAIAKLSAPLSVDIVEPGKNAQEVAKSRLEEVKGTHSHDFSWHDSIQELKDRSDLAIVATSAIGRVHIIDQLLEAGHSRFLVEKMVCQSAKEYETLLANMKLHKAKGWVNTPRRYYTSYQKIKNHISSSKPIHVSVVSGNVGLGSNAIHFLDLFSWFCDDYKIKLGGEFLDSELLSNKRGQDLVEFAGTIVGSSSGGSAIEISFMPQDGGGIPQIIDIVAEDTHFVIDETDGKFYALKSANSDLDNLKFQNEHVSDLTAKIAGDILAKDDCSLPSLQDSHIAHKELFSIFNAHIKKMTGKETERCPIT